MGLVRFTKFSDYINKHSHHFVYDRCIGRPERIWFERNDKVSQIFDKLGDGSKAFYFFNESHVPSNLTKNVLPLDLSIYDVVIDPLQNSGNVNRVLLISVAD